MLVTVGDMGGGEENMLRSPFDGRVWKSKGTEGLSFPSALTCSNCMICLAGLLHLKSPHRALFPWP